VPTSPSMKQKRRNQRTPETKVCVALTDTFSDSRRTAAVTSLATKPAIPRSDGRPSTNRRTRAEYNATVPVANPRSASR
jgi:hypothetical protein